MTTPRVKEPADRKPPARRAPAKKAAAPRAKQPTGTGATTTERARAATAAAAKSRRRPPAATTEELAEEALTVPPDGAPGLVTFAGMSRRQRADFVVALAKIQDSLKAQGISEDLSSDDLAELPVESQAQFLVLVADIEDLLRPTAVDPAAFDEWARESSDREFMQLFKSFVADMGEAEASPS